MDMQTTLKLADLYRRREQLQKYRERAMDRNFWLGFVNRGAAPAGSVGDNVRSISEIEMMAEAIGGTGALASVILIGVVEAISTIQTNLDGEITGLGGEI